MRRDCLMPSDLAAVGFCSARFAAFGCAGGTTLLRPLLEPNRCDEVRRPARSTTSRVAAFDALLSAAAPTTAIVPAVRSCGSGTG